MYQKLPINPGVYKDDTPLTAEGFFIAADKIRFRRGLPETMGGWELLTSVALTGKCRALTTWSDNTLVKWIGAGTHSNLYAVTDSTIYDITPVIAYGHVSISFTTVISTTTVTADWTAHGLVQGQAFDFSNSTVSSVGGVTINTNAATSAIPSPQYIVLAVNTANQITFTAAQTATSSAGPTAATVDYRQYLAPGLADSIGALGYGTGLYSTSSTYSTPSTGDVFCRTWSLCPYGQNLMGSPRNGKIYEWKPGITAAELTTNGTFTGSATGWTLGAGWAYGADNIVATASSATVTQSITTPANAFFIASMDMSGWATGAVTVSFNSATIISSQATNNTFKATFWSSGATSNVSINATNLTATIDNISVKQLLTAEVVPNAPTQNTAMLVTPEAFVMAFGTINATTSNFDPMLIRWSDIGSKTTGEQTWTPASTNLAGSVRLLVGSRIINAKIGNNEILVWTDKALYALTYANNSNIVYTVRLVGMNCGLIGFNAATVLGGVAYWMTPAGTYYSYSGGSPTPIPSGIQKDVFDHISLVQQDKINAGTIGGFNDVIFLYPDSRDGSECSRYALLCTQESAPSPPGVNLGPIGVFAPGTFDRLAWHDAGVNAYPIAVDSSGYLYYHEKGNSANGGTFTWSLETGAIQIGSGTTQFMVDTFIPDFQNFLGGATLTAYAYLYPQSTPVSHGPFNITSGTEQVSMLADAPVGREIAILFSGSSAPASIRAGHLQFDIQDTGMTF